MKEGRTMKRSIIVGLIIVFSVLINMTAFSCLEQENPVHCKITARDHVLRNVAMIMGEGWDLAV